jgi:hypothetical protein
MPLRLRRRFFGRLGGLLQVLVELLVVEQRLRGRLAVVDAAVGVAGRFEGDDDVVAQILVLDEPLDVRAGPVHCGVACGLGGLALRCHHSHLGSLAVSW